MQVSKITNVYPDNKNELKKQKSAILPKAKAEKPFLSDVASSYIRANYAPLSFKGNIKEIKDAYIITGESDDVPLLATKKNNSYVVDFDSQTEIVYGKHAYSYLKDRDYFEYDTQIIFPKKASGRLITKYGKEIKLGENSVALINAGTNASVKVDQGYPMIILSKKDYDWYERYKKDAKDETIKNKFLELIYYNSHLYDGNFSLHALLPSKLNEVNFLSSVGIDKYKSRNNILEDLYQKRELLSQQDKEQVEFAKELADKLIQDGIISEKQDGYYRFNILYNPEYEEKYLFQKGYTKEQIETIMPVFKKARQARMDSRFSFKNPVKDYPPELIIKMKQHGILHDNKKLADEFIFWKDVFANETDMWNKLRQEGFSDDEIKIIVDNWKKYNMTGYDLSGLRFIDSQLAVYDFSGKLNNWTQEGTNWITNSTALSSGSGTSPFVGVSMVQSDKSEILPMPAIRSEEKLHAHPNLEEKRQTEIYLITSGAAALNVVKDGKSQVKILHEGDLAVVGPGVMHSINSIAGEYEHIVSQVPSTFQYGFSFKQIVEPPKDYDEEKLAQEAFMLLENYKS